MTAHRAASEGDQGDKNRNIGLTWSGRSTWTPKLNSSWPGERVEGMRESIPEEKRDSENLEAQRRIQVKKLKEV